MTSLEITHLNSLVTELRLVQKHKWRELGLKLGLYQPTLDAIDHNHRGNVERCFEACLSAWLRKADGVEEPTRSSLDDALKYIDGATAADSQSLPPSPPATSTSATTTVHEYVPDNLRDTYVAMNGRFATLLVSVVNEIRRKHSLEDIKEYLILFEARTSNELNKIKDDRQFKEYLRKHCHLSNFGFLEVLVDYFKLKSCKNKIEQFTKDRMDFFEEIKATDFAKQVIKDHKDSAQRTKLTFAVSWSLQQTTLMEFEEFLNRIFHEHRIHISLQSVHHSLLTFVCTIPVWIVDELISEVNDKRHSLYVNGVIQVIIADHTLIIENEYNLLLEQQLFQYGQSTLFPIMAMFPVLICMHEANITELFIILMIMGALLMVLFKGLLNNFPRQSRDIHNKVIIDNEEEKASLKMKINVLKQKNIDLEAKLANDKEVSKLKFESEVKSQPHPALLETENKQDTDKKTASEEDNGNASDTNEHNINTCDQTPSESQQNDLLKTMDQAARKQNIAQLESSNTRKSEEGQAERKQEIDVLPEEVLSLKEQLKDKEAELQTVKKINRSMSSENKKLQSSIKEKSSEHSEQLREKDKMIEKLQSSKAELEETSVNSKKEIEALQEKISLQSVQLLDSPSRIKAQTWNSRVPTLYNDWREDHIPPVLVVMTSFSSYRKTNEHWYSPSFLSHERGYRMCLKIKANGEDEVKRTHLSVSVHLMMGDNDDTLSWPFRGVVKVELVNRRFNGRNHKGEITFSDTSNQKASQRVFNGIPLQTGMASFMGQGGIEFIRQNDLAFNPQTGIEYLKDDNIKLKVISVNIETIPATVPDVPSLETNVLLPVIEFQIDRFFIRKASNEEYISKPFYSHPSDKGYKFALFVYPNGRGDYKGKSVSVFVHLMKGEYDSELEFPFRGELLVQILNHSNKKQGHVEKPITFSKETDPNSKYGAQVAGITTWFSSGRSFEGYGFPNFLSHEFLKVSPNRNTQYVSDDDILLMRVVKITTHSTVNLKVH